MENVQRKSFPSGIKLFHDAQNSAVDLIFVHGLTGDREKTWTAKGAAAPWPQTLLLAKLPNIRVLTFGYDAYVADWQGVVSKNRIGNHSMNLLTAVATYRENDDTNDRPIIFVCHSLGGLVCQDALVAAAQRPESHLRSILHLTRGIVFLGTPHHGSGLAKIAEMLVRSIGVLKQTNAQIVATLESDSEVLARIQDSFHTLIRSRCKDGIQSIEITCFYEELPLPGVGVVVPSHSAILPGYTAIGIRSNHMDMTKFEDENDPGFAMVTGELCRWVRHITTHGGSGFASSSISQQQHIKHQSRMFLVPYTCNYAFVGRSDILNKLKGHFGFALQQTLRVKLRAALYGLGGIGKTQIALAYAYWVQEECPDLSVFWVHASNPERFRQAYSQISQSCQIPGCDDPKADTLSLVRSWLERKEQCQWLMIIDNADDTDIFFTSGLASSKTAKEISLAAIEPSLGRYIPECSHGHILITTRNKRTGVKLTKNQCIIEVGQMDQTESCQLMCKKLDDNKLSTDDISNLAARLENLPLALVQAAAFIRENCLTITRYLQLLDRSDSTLVKLLNEPFEEGGRDSSVPNAVAATWIISFKQIREQHRRASELLSLISLFERQEIPCVFLSHYCKQEDSYKESRQDQEDQTEHQLELEKALGVLKAFSFVVEGRDSEKLSMHRLVRLVMHRWLNQEGEFIRWASQALATVSDLYPYRCHENRELCKVYLPHAYAVLGYKGSGSSADEIARALLLHRIAGFMLYQGKWTAAEQLLVQAADTRKRVLGAEHPSTLTSMAGLASTYTNQGRWKEAEELFVQVMETSSRVLGAEHPDTLTCLTNLATTYMNQGRWKEAEELEVQVLETSIRVLPPEHPDTLTSMVNLGLTLASTYSNQGRWKDAEKLFMRIMEASSRVLGADHPFTLTSMANLASTFSSQGRWEEAGELFTQVIKMEKRVLEAEHPSMLASMANLAPTLLYQGRWKEAEELFIQVIERSSRVLGAEHPRTLICMANLALTFSNQRRWKEAEKLEVQVMETSSRVLGAEHPDTLTSMTNLASTYRNQGRYKEAISLLGKCFQLQRQILSPQHPYTAASLKTIIDWEIEYRESRL